MNNRKRRFVIFFIEFFSLPSGRASLFFSLPIPPHSPTFSLSLSLCLSVSLSLSRLWALGVEDLLLRSALSQVVAAGQRRRGWAETHAERKVSTAGNNAGRAVVDA